ncbi:MAG: CHASE domain-containing protein [Gammaproteobacteria bacterium]
MKTSSPLDKSLVEERSALAKSGELHWTHWSVIGLSIVLTFSAWHIARSQADQKISIQFDRESNRVLELVQERMHKYEDALWGGAATIQSHGGEISHQDWKTFASSLHLETTYPGISGIGVIKHIAPEQLQQHIEKQRQTRPNYKVHPFTSGLEHMPIVYIEPEEPNAKAVGLDMAHEENRYEAAKKARRTGTAQITGTIYLVQDSAPTPGFLFYAPYYKDGVPTSADERRNNFEGLVYAPFTVAKLIKGTLRKESRQVRIKLSDGADVLYSELESGGDGFDPNPMFSKTKNLDFYGRTWQFEIQTTDTFRRAYATNEPMLILLGGFVIDSLLLGLFLLLTKANRRALRFADRMTNEYQIKGAALEELNNELERLAYITSHDLKTPLRGINDLAYYIQEDLKEIEKSVDLVPDVHFNLERIHKQTNRMENLINGILDYSSVGTRTEMEETIDVSAILHDLMLELRIRQDQIVLTNDLPEFKSHKTRFNQVMNNLVGNAFKYHPDLTKALVTISCNETEDFLEFSITDNGPGIDPKFHKRIFEVFQTLQSRDQVESTGVGLSIVKKSVEAIGGTIEVYSKLGEGTTFQFTWPKHIPDDRPINIAVR